LYCGSLKVIDSEGLRGYIDVECLQNELSEVTGMSSRELNEAAHELLTSQTTGAPAPSVTTESDAGSDDPCLTTSSQPKRDLYEHEYSV